MADRRGAGSHARAGGGGFRDFAAGLTGAAVVVDGFAPGSPPDITFGIQPIMVAMPTTLKTISTTAAINITG